MQKGYKRPKHPSTVGAGCQVSRNSIPEKSNVITPQIPLVTLESREFENVVRTVPRGVGNVQDVYPLAPVQEGMLFHHLIANEGDPYLRVSLSSFDSDLELQAYLKALQAVVDRHDILRTAILWEGLSQPVQVVWRNATLPVEEIEADSSAGDLITQLRSRFNPRRIRIDIRQAPLLRIKIMRDTSCDRWLLLMLFHHLAYDGVTLEIMKAEIQAHLLGNADHLPVPESYRSFVAEARLGVSKEQHEEFFHRMLAGIDQPTAPFGLLEVLGDGSELGEAYCEVDADLVRRLKKRATELGARTTRLYHLAWAQVLARVSGRDDVVFGTMISGRARKSPEEERPRPMMGPAMNILPIRMEVGNNSAKASVERTHALVSELAQNKHASLALIRRCSSIAAPTPLFSALFNYRRRPDFSKSLGARSFRGWEGAEGIYGGLTNYPLALAVDELGEKFRLTVQVQAPIEPMRVCRMMHTALERLVEALEHTPQKPICDIDVLPEAERHQVVQEWNSTKTELPNEHCIHELFEAQVEKNSDAVAVVYEDEQLTYSELNAQANQLAHYLRELGVKPDDRVAICAERGLQMIVGIVGILKAGGAYVPLDPAYPAERLAYMLRDSAPVVLLTQGISREILPDLPTGLPVLDLAASHLPWANQPVSNLDPTQAGLTSKHLAYIIYTSGSTGTPKGVMVEHRNVSRLFVATEAWFQFGSSDVWTLFHSYAFDFSVWEIWGALLYGARLVVVPLNTTRSPRDFYQLVCRAKVTILNQTPSAFRQLIAAQGQAKEQHHLRCVIFGGEALDVAMLKPWFGQNPGQHTKLVNMYGITETTVHVTYRMLELEDTARRGGSPIGCRIPDLRIYILDIRREPVPIGVTGELYVGGAGVARGYLNRPELTAQRFLADPFSKEPGARMYKTGDLGRWLIDGNIEFLGRNDFQVKIRGFRVELGEIEAKLTEHPGVREAVVVAPERGAVEDKRLVAYYVPTELEDDSSAVSAATLRDLLSAQLPDYMVPAAYVPLKAMPLTTNKKLDRRALPTPNQEAYVARGYEAPQGQAEKDLAEIWAELLKVWRVGRHDNFFELGGHSLLAVTLMERMRRIGVHVEIRSLFTNPTLAGIASLKTREISIVDVPPNQIPERCTLITPQMVPLIDLTPDEIELIVASVPGGAPNVQDIYPLVPLQEGILFHHLMAKEGDPYLLSALYAFDTRARLESYLKAWQAVIDRHDILRTGIVWEGVSEPVQVVWRHAPLSVENVVPNSSDGDVAEQLRGRIKPRSLQLDVRKAPLMRAYTAHDKPNDRWLLLLINHHLTEDNTSLKNIRAELRTHLMGDSDELPTPIPFRNFVTQTRRGANQKEHEEFFRQLLDHVDEPTAPFALMEVQGDGTHIEEAHLKLNSGLANPLRVRARMLGVSTASLCHVAWAQVLGRVSRRNDVVFGTVLFGRMQGGEGGDRGIGLFINTLPIRIRLDNTTAGETVRRTHSLLAELLRHEHASLALVQRCSAVAAPTPLFSALLNYRHNQRRDRGSLTQMNRDLKGVQMLWTEERTNYPLTLSVDDFAYVFERTVQVQALIAYTRLFRITHRALQHLLEALEHPT